MGPIVRPQPRIWYMCIGLTAGVLLTVPAVLLAFFSAGGGHGDYLWAKVLFPYTMIIPLRCGGPIGLPLIIVAFAQFPFYGSLVGAFASSLKTLLATAVVICCLHAGAVAVCLCCAAGNFS